LAAPQTLLIPFEDFEYGRFTHVGRFGDGNQFMAYVTFASPKFYHTEVETSDGQVIWQQHVNCFAVLHRFDPAGKHLGTAVERVTPDGSDEAKLQAMIAALGPVKLSDIRVCPFEVQIGKVLHGLIYECEDAEDLEDPDATLEYVMLYPNDIMFHPPWDSGEYST
jgi:hypothetical protein